MKELTNLNHEQLQMLVRMMYELDNLADIVIIDTGAGISDTVVELVLASSGCFWLQHRNRLLLPMHMH